VARRQLLTEEERRLFFGIAHDTDALTRHYSFTRSDRELLAARRGNANRLGFAVQLALLRHPGMGLAHMEEPIEALVAWLAERLNIPAAGFAKYASRAQTMTDHARILAAALGLRPASAADLPFMIEAAAQSASSTDHGQPIVAGVIAALRANKVILPAPAVIERAAIAGRARARKRAADALLAGVSEVQIAKLEKLLVVDSTLKATRLAWLRNAPSSPKADHVSQLIERLRFVRDIGLSADAAARVHDNRFQQFIREGRISNAHQVGRYAAPRRRAILAANVIDLEA
jgi:TnpA family transposase